jgi:hypothetical protein
MTIGELLMSQPRWGTSRTRKFLALLPMRETKVIGSLTDRQCRQLAKVLRNNPAPCTAIALAAG